MPADNLNPRDRADQSWRPSKSTLDTIAATHGLPRLSLIADDVVFVAKSYMLAFKLAEDARIPPRQRINLDRYGLACIALMERRPVTPASLARSIDGETWCLPLEGQP